MWLHGMTKTALPQVPHQNTSSILTRTHRKVVGFYASGFYKGFRMRMDTFSLKSTEKRQGLIQRLRCTVTNNSTTDFVGFTDINIRTYKRSSSSQRVNWKQVVKTKWERKIFFLKRKMQKQLSESIKKKSMFVWLLILKDHVVKQQIITYNNISKLCSWWLFRKILYDA